MYLITRINKPKLLINQIGIVKTKHRSKWKGVYNLVLRERTRRKGYRFFPKVFNRSSTILPMHIDIRFYVHRGSNYQQKIITKELVGHKFGELSLNSQIGSDIHKTLKNKNKYKQKKK